ncbi:MAG: acyl-CoA dehydratase activase, partial [Syntrophales bacterium]|nr:acyl-CoA dehydratase activase [Syntrophales bacterium]
MRWLGVCIGASTLSIVEVLGGDTSERKISNVTIEPHHGNPQELFMRMMGEIDRNWYHGIAVTGRSFRHAVNLTSIAEPEAVERALLFVNGHNESPRAIVSAGGETFILYVLDRDGKIGSIQAGNKCASGTGEFFLQQIRRMGLSPDEAVELARSEDPYRVSGRCSVFCKSDCTHALNKGIPKGRIAGGLCRMMAAKVLEIIKQVPRRDIMIIGGCAQNSVMVDYLEEEIDNLHIPSEAPYFEALGAALWAAEHDTIPFPGKKNLLNGKGSLFYRLPPLKSAESLVEFKEVMRGKACDGDRCILGLDVGSTTTKAVLLRSVDDQVIASVYLRTQGDPVGASRQCYAALLEELGTTEIILTGVGVTGSGRQIAGLHALTEGVVNEIIAHATGALAFDGEVDTIFEIGGQDAKYTYITNGVASDYAMNEACSAGTGSFLEESARETLGIEMEEIAEYALKGSSPPNFNDQCAAFISSDIKNAFNEGIRTEDILAGLVYSICMNYTNRVRGNRPAGNKIFMQGGVCYNRAVPHAMAALTGKPIVVPPDPGLIGAFGVALEIKRRITLGFMKEQKFSLTVLRDREIEYGSPFICNGGKEGCDRKCEIARIKLEGKIYPFGGACNRWYNIRSRIQVDTGALNRAGQFEKLIFDQYKKNADTSSSTLKEDQTLSFSPLKATAKENLAGRKAQIIGINKSFQVNTYFPLYYHFFDALGFKVLCAGGVRQEGMDRKNAPFCYPAEIAHG